MRPAETPLFRLCPDAAIESVGQLELLDHDSLHFRATGFRPNLVQPLDGYPTGRFPGLPWFLDDLRPDGFLGRAFARSCRGWGLPSDPDLWQPQHTVWALMRSAGQTRGDLLVGTAAVESALSALEMAPDQVNATQRRVLYPQRATAALRGECPQISLGGQQPKFTATVAHSEGRYAALVKFALPGAGEAAERWADLLVCEHLALEVLRDAGMSAAASTILQTDHHTFLEVRRFDRSPDSLGRRGFTSLLALYSAFVGDVTVDWGEAGEQLLALRWIDKEAAAGMARLHAFGRLIGNSDMHQGNIGFHLADAGPLPLAPAYDMLPMSLAPSRTGVLRATTPLAPVAPVRSGQLAHLQWAAPRAADYWERVAGSRLIRSTALAAVAAENVLRVREMAGRYG